MPGIQNNEAMRYRYRTTLTYIVKPCPKNESFKNFKDGISKLKRMGWAWQHMLLITKARNFKITHTHASAHVHIHACTHPSKTFS